ncbi:hypothetical protein Tco_1073707 [Tanacetum coccineum]
MDLLSDVALLKVVRLKKTLKKSKLETHKLHASGSGDGVGSQPKVPDEQEDKTTGTYEGTSTKPGVPDVPKYLFEKASDSEKMDSDEDENYNLNQNDDEEEEHEEEYVRTPDSFEFNDDDDDEKYEELYKDVNTKYEQVKDDEHVTLTTVHDTQKTEGPMQSLSVSYDFVRHVEPSTQNLPLLNIPVKVIPETSTTAGPTISLTIPPITHLQQQSAPTPTPAPTTATTTTSVPALPDFSSLFGFDQRVSALEKELSQLKQAYYSAQLLEMIKSYTAEFEKKAKDERKRCTDLVEKSVKDIIKDEVKSQLPQILPKEVSGYATPVIQSSVTESLENIVLAKSSSQPKSTYEAAASLTEFELKKILLDKIQKSKSYQGAQEHKDLYDALRDREDKDKDEDPPARSDQRLKKQKTSKDAKPLRGSNSKESKSSLSKGSKTRSKSSGKSAQAEEPMFETTDIEMTLNQGDDMAFNVLKGTCKSQVELEYHFEECYKAVTDKLDWTNPEGHEYPFDLSKPLPLIEDQGRQVVPANYFFNNDLEYLKGGSLSSKYTTSTIKTKVAKYDTIEGIEDMVPSLWSPVKHDVFSTKRIIAITHVKVVRNYDYGYLDEIIIQREDQSLHKFVEGDYDIEDMLLLLVQKKLSNLERDDLFDLNVALQMFTRRVVILKRVEDLQLGVESYKKKLDLTRPETFRFDISSMTPYNAYNNPQGIIYQDKFKRNRLIRSDELYKFCDGTLTSVRRVLHDIASSL